MLTAGLAAITAVAASWMMRLVTGGSRLGWMTPVQMFALEMAGAFLIAALGTSYFVPRTSDASRVEPGARGLSPILVLLLAALAIVALAHVPSLTAWWAEDHLLLTQATGSERDPTGLRMIPAVILFSLPTVAALALVTFVLTSIVGMLGRPELAPAVLTGCAFLQAGVVIGEQFLLRAMAALGSTVLGAIARSPDADATAQVTEWLARHDAAAAGPSWRLLWIVGGYAVAAAASRFLQSHPHGAEQVSAAAPVTDAAVPAPFPSVPVETLPTVTSSAASAFPHPSYSVRARQNFVELFLRRYSTYDITSIPPSTQSRFSFSWRNGILRREPNGPDLLAVTRGDRYGMSGGREHRVTDVATGGVVGLLRSVGSDWEIADASGTRLARIVEERSGVGYITYAALMNGQPVCRFTWAMQGLTVASGALDVEFVSADSPVDRAFAIAVAPVLEHKARRASERRT